MFKNTRARLNHRLVPARNGGRGEGEGSCPSEGGGGRVEVYRGHYEGGQQVRTFLGLDF